MVMIGDKPKKQKRKKQKEAKGRRPIEPIQRAKGSLYKLGPKKLGLKNRKNRPTYEAEIYHQARLRGLIPVIRPVFDYEGKVFRPTMVFVDGKGKPYALVRIGKDNRMVDTHRKYTRTGLPWAMIQGEQDIFPVLEFVASKLYERDYTRKLNEHSTQSADNTGNRGNTGAERKRSGKSQAPVKGALVPPRSIGGFGKFR